MNGFKSVTYRLLSKMDKKRQTQNIVGIALVLLLICGLMGVLYFNTSQFNQKLSIELTNANKSTSVRIANQINYVINRKLSTIDELNKTMESMPQNVLSEQFFSRYKRMSGLTELFIVDKNGNLKFGLNGHYLVLQWLNENDKLSDNSIVAVPNNGIALIDCVTIGGNDLYTIGYVDKSYLMNLMISYSEGKNYTVSIINGDGVLVAGNHNSTNAKALETIVSNDTLMNRLARINETSQSQAVFDLPNSNDLVILTGVGYFDSILMTIVPQSLLTNQMSGFVHNYNTILVYFVIAFIALIILLVSSFNRNIQLVERVAYTDEMTQGYNNTAFLVFGNSCIRKIEHAYIVYFNITSFRSINNQFGMDIGNQWIIEFYNLLKGQCGESEFVSRSDNDHFYLFMNERDQQRVVQRIARICELANKNQFLASFKQMVCFEIGACEFNEGDDIVIIQDQAKIASKRNKGVCDKVVFYDNQLKALLEKEETLIQGFNHAIDKNEFQIYLQPKVDAKTGKLAAAEALVRWQHPSYGLLFPDSFIHLLESHKLIGRLDLYVFEKACQLLKEWKEKGWQCIPISVNLSRVQITSNDLSPLNRYFELKDSYGIDDGLLEVECTESVMFEKNDFELAKEFIEVMHNHGIDVSLDDFGQGYSSLSVLKEFNVDVVKLDKAFFSNDSEKSWVVISSFINLAHQLNMKVVSEGIENLSQVETLRKYGCDMIQGYVYSKPLPIDQFLQKYTLEQTL